MVWICYLLLIYIYDIDVIVIDLDPDTPTEQCIIDMYQKLLWSTQASNTSKQYILVSLVKLSTRLRTGQE